MTKRFFIWLFWYLLLSVALMSIWRKDDGTVQLPSWWGAGGAIVLFAWWGRFLAVKYPSKQKLIYIVAGVFCVLLAAGAMSS